MKAGVQNTKNASETPNLIIYMGKKQEFKGPKGYKNPGKGKSRPNHTLMREIRSGSPFVHETRDSSTQTLRK